MFFIIAMCVFTNIIYIFENWNFSVICTDAQKLERSKNSNNELKHTQAITKISYEKVEKSIVMPLMYTMKPHFFWIFVRDFTNLNWKLITENTCTHTHTHTHTHTRRGITKKNWHPKHVMCGIAKKNATITYITYITYITSKTMCVLCVP